MSLPEDKVIIRKWRSILPRVFLRHRSSKKEIWMPFATIKVKKEADPTAVEPSDGSDENLPDFLAQLFPG